MEKHGIKQCSKVQTATICGRVQKDEKRGSAMTVNEKGSGHNELNASMDNQKQKSKNKHKGLMGRWRFIK